MATLRHPPAPFTAPMSGTLEQRLAAVADAINANRNQIAILQTGALAYPFLRLIDASGQTWQITVDLTGALQTALVPRS